MNTRAISFLIALSAAAVLPSCTTVVKEPAPAPITTQATTTTTTADRNPYSGTTTHRKVETTTQY